MDKIIQTLILWNTSPTAVGKQNNTWFAYKKVLLHLVCPAGSDFQGIPWRALKTSWRGVHQHWESQGYWWPLEGKLCVHGLRDPLAIGWEQICKGTGEVTGLCWKKSSGITPGGARTEIPVSQHCSTLLLLLGRNSHLIWHPILKKIHFTRNKPQYIHGQYHHSLIHSVVATTDKKNILEYK